MEGTEGIGASNSTDIDHAQPRLCGYLIAGWERSPSKSRWLAFQPETCKLYVYKTELDPLPIKDIDIARAVFVYDADKSESGQFCIRSGTDNLHLESGSVESRDYWLNRLRQERRSYGYKCLYLLQNPELRACFAQTRSVVSRPHTGLLAPALKKSTSQAAEPVNKAQAECEPGVVLRRPPYSTPSPTSPLSRNPHAFKLSSPTDNDEFPHSSLNTISSLGKRIRHSFRERRRSNRQSGDASHHKSNSSMKDCDGCKQLSSQLMVLQEDLKATEDEFEASRKVIEILQDQIEVLSRENKTLLEVNKQVTKYDDHKVFGILKEKEIALVKLENKYRKLMMKEEKLEATVEKLQDENALYKELHQAKDKTIIELTNQIHDFQEGGVERCSKAVQTDRMAKDLNDALEAFSSQNKFLNEELVETSQLLQQSSQREEKLLIEASDWEARFYQIQSKYMLILNELQTPQCNQNKEKLSELISRLMGDCVTGTTPALRSSSNRTYDVYGFQQLELVAASSCRNSSSASQQECGSSLQDQWDGIVTLLDSADILNLTGLKALIRTGIPYHQRGLVWKAIMNCHLRGSRKYSEPDFYKTVFQFASQHHLSPAAKQIETDLLRTLPNNRHYEGIHADGIPKLRRVLIAYSIYNPDVGYCQGLNRLVAILLLFLSEEDSFWGLVYVVDYLLPLDYYGQKLTGAQIDQRVLKDLIAEKIPRLSAHLSQFHVDISLVTFNWFLCIFVDSLPVELFMRVWDTFWYEGSKVLFRYAIAVLKLNESFVLQQTDYVTILSTLKNRVEKLTDIDEVTKVAFEEVNPFPMRIITQKREHHRKIVKMELENLDTVRRDYQRKLADSPDANGNKTRFF